MIMPITMMMMVIMILMMPVRHRGGRPAGPSQESLPAVQHAHRQKVPQLGVLCRTIRLHDRRHTGVCPVSHDNDDDYYNDADARLERFP